MNQTTSATNAEIRKVRPYRIRDIRRREMRVMLSVIRVSAWPSCSAMTAIGTPFIASVDPCVWREDMEGILLSERWGLSVHACCEHNERNGVTYDCFEARHRQRERIRPIAAALRTA